MTLKEYQQDIVDVFGRWYDLLKEEKSRAEKIRIEIENLRGKNGNEVIIKALEEKAELDLSKVWSDFGKTNWVERKSQNGTSIPHVCIKVPTGGGKTRIAAAIIKSINKKRGLILWMVPSDSIMQQTQEILKDKTNPIRKILDTTSGKQTKIIEKDKRFSKTDLDNNLCVMPIMQQSTNRQSKNFLKMYRDNSNYTEFFPDTDDKEKQGKLLPLCLDTREGTTQPRTSLANVFRMVKPTIILDEAHKASAKNIGVWADFVNKLGPELVIELTATPNEEESNIIKTVSGRELRNESMIKENIVVSMSKQNWKGVLNSAVKELDKLSRDATTTNKYIRPIMVIRVERTDSNQRDKNFIHAFDVREHLTKTLAIPPEQVAIKTASHNDLKGESLMDDNSHIRYIITKNALMEGWDCPFAYMLVILDNLKKQRALTQLLGRVMRQPYTKYFDKKSLNDCYVYCISDDSESVIKMIQSQLDNEGFTDMENNIIVNNETPEKRINARQPKFQNLDITLPKVSHKSGDTWIELDYQSHILSQIPWSTITISSDEKPEGVNKENRIKIDSITGEYEYVGTESDNTPKISEWVSTLSDLVPNPWQAARIVSEFWKSTGMKPHEINKNEEILQEELDKKLREKIIKKSESLFRNKLKKKIIKFDLNISSTNYQMRGEYETWPEDGKVLKRIDRKSIQQNLYEPIYREDFDGESEQKFASYLDEAKAIEWWHRVVAKDSGDYYLRGWQKDKIYPDFITIFSKKNGRIFRIYEIKGKQLDNPDTKYKKKVLKLLGETLAVGNLNVTGGKLEGDFKLVFEDSIKSLPKTELLKGKPVKAMNLCLVSDDTTD